MDTHDRKKIYRTNAAKELTEHFTYARLARMEKNTGNRDALTRLAEQERTHYAFWKMLLEETDPQAAAHIAPHRMTVWAMAAARTVLGITFITKFLEIHENDAVANYEAIRADIPPAHQARFAEIIEDEKAHERTFIGELKEVRVDYIGFIVLGLADAIVEITGVHAGFLGVTGQTLIAGVAGVIVGFAAAISMGSAAYLQAKEDPKKSPFISALATGLSYFSSVILLALPYFLIRAMIPAFAISTSVGIALIAGFTFYGAIVFDRSFWREFGEAAGLMLGTAIATFIWGNIIGKIFGIQPASF
jgi:VIT1/CCC1 family predicted Fe2+/Mn2+ transporter